MANEPNIKVLDKILAEVLAEFPECYLVQMKIKPTNNIKVFLDGDQGVTIETCTKVNRKLYSVFEERSLYPDGNFSLEVSSAGVGEPLLMFRQYVKNIGRFLKVETCEGPYTPTPGTPPPATTAILEGELKAATEDGIVVEVTTGKGKKLEVKQHSILFDNIKSTSVQIKF